MNSGVRRVKRAPFAYPLQEYHIYPKIFKWVVRTRSIKYRSNPTKGQYTDFLGSKIQDPQSNVDSLFIKGAAKGVVGDDIVMLVGKEHHQGLVLERFWS